VTVTGTRALPSPHTWVIPSLVPSSPEKVRVALDMSRSLELDLDVDVGGQVEPHERVDRLRRRVDDVDEPLVGAHLEVLAAVLVLVRGADHDDYVLLRGQRHRADDLGSRTRDGVDDLARGAVEPSVVVRLQSDADLLSRHGFLVPCAPQGTRFVACRPTRSSPPGSPGGSARSAPLFCFGCRLPASGMRDPHRRAESATRLRTPSPRPEGRSTGAPRCSAARGPILRSCTT